MKKIISAVLVLCLLFNILSTSLLSLEASANEAGQNPSLTGKADDSQLVTLIKMVNSRNNHAYALVEKAMSWNDALAFCKGRGGYLATITSREEQTFISTILSNQKEGSYWLGASGNSSQKSWNWVTGEEFQYFNFDNKRELKQKGFLSIDSKSKNWKVISNSYKESDSVNGFICEWDSNKVMSFDGEMDYIKTDGLFDTRGLPVSLEAWVKPELRTDNGISETAGTPIYPANVVATDSKNHTGIGFGVNVYKGGSSLTIQYCGGLREITGVKFVPSEWYHICVVYTYGNYKVYVNGTLVESFSFHQAGEFKISAPMQIGRASSELSQGQNSRNFFHGSVDDVRIWGIPLSAEKVMENINSSVEGKESGLLHFWNFNEDSGRIAYDISEGKLHATLYNNPERNAADPALNTYAIEPDSTRSKLLKINSSTSAVSADAGSTDTQVYSTSAPDTNLNTPATTPEKQDVTPIAGESEAASTSPHVIPDAGATSTPSPAPTLSTTLSPSPSPSPSPLPGPEESYDNTPTLAPVVPPIPAVINTPTPSPSPTPSPLPDSTAGRVNMAPEDTQVPSTTPTALPTATPTTINVIPGPTGVNTNVILQNDTTIEGNLNLNGGTYDLNGHHLIVKGDIFQTAGVMSINKGRLDVFGDYRIQKVSIDEEDNIIYSNSNGYLAMSTNSDYVSVAGSFVVQSVYGSPLSAGTLEIKGDFIQRNGYEYCFTSSGTHKVILSGTKTQTISFASPNYSYFANLDLTQASGIILDPPSLQAKSLSGIEKITLQANKTALTLINTSTKLTADTLLSYSLTLQGGTLDLAGKKLTLSGDLINQGTLNINGGKIEGVKNLTLTAGSFDVGGSEFKIEGDLLMSGGTFDLNKGKVTIDGNVLQSGGDLKVHQGHLEVAGEYRIQNKTIDEEDQVIYSNCSGRIIMDNDADYIKIGGDFTTQSNYGSSLSAGTFELLGNFTQVNSGYYNFYCTGTNKVIFSGVSSQSIAFDQTDYSYFNTLDISNAKAVVMNSDILPAKKLIGLEKISKSLATGELMLKNTTVTLASDMTLNSGLNIAGGSFDFAGKKLTISGDLLSSGNVTINGGQINGVNHLTITNGTFDIGGSELNIKEDVFLYGGSFDLNRGKVTVGGMVRHTGGEMNIHIGKLDVAGDYKMQIEAQDEEGNILYSNSRGYLTMTRASDYMRVRGDFVTQSTYGSNLTAGTMEFNKGFKQVKNGYGTFCASGTHKVIFSGTTLQNIGFDDYDYNYFNIMDLASSAGIVVDPAVLPARSLTGIGDKIKIKPGNKILTLKNTTTALVSDMILNCGLNLAAGNLDLAGKKLTLAGDLISSGNITINAGKIDGVDNFTVTNNTFDLGGSELNVKGNLLFTNGTIDLNKGKLTIGGMVRHTGGQMNIHIGKLDIAGDYKIQTESVDEEGYIHYGNSSGNIVMTRSSDLVTVGGNFVLQSTYGSNLTAGTMEFKGNFIQVKNGGYGTFNAGGTHKVIFSGASTQTIDFDEPDYHSFNILDLTQAKDIYVDPSVLPVKSLTGMEKLRIKAGNTLVLKNTTTTLTTDVTVNGGLNFAGGSIDLAGKKITVAGNLESSANVTINSGKIEGINSFTITNGIFDVGGSDLNVKGDLYLSRGTLDLNKGNVTIGGMVRHTGGEMNIHIGKLNIAGDYKLQSETKDEEGRIIYGNSTGYLVMTRNSDYVKVGGNFVLQSTYSSSLTAGTMEIKGNFRQIKTNYGVFNASGTHKVIFNGMAEQIIGFDEPDYNTFNILDLSQTSGILVEPQVLPAKSLTGLEKLKVKAGNTLTLKNTATTLAADVNLNSGLTLNGGSIDLAGKSIKLAGDLAISGNILINAGKIEGTNNLTITSGTLDVGGSDFNVQGDVLFTRGTFDLNRGKVTVGGRILQSGGEMNIHIGRLDVAGDYKIQNETKNSEGSLVVGNSNGYMVMTRNSDYVKVHGNFVVQSTYGSNLTAGTMELNGNFAQKLVNCSNFNPLGTHKVILNGTAEQVVSFEDTSYSYFNTLDVTQAVKVIVENSILPVKTLYGFNKIGVGKDVTQLTLKNATVSMNEDNTLNCGLTLVGGSFNLGGRKLNLSGDFTSSAQFSTNGGNVEGVQNLTINGGLLDLGGSTLHVAGNTLFTSGKIDIHGGKLIINGNLLQPGGEMNIHMGRLEVGGDYKIQTESKKEGNVVSYTDSSGYLIMSRTSDYVLVDGNFTTQSNNWSNILSAGTFELKGDFTQKNSFNVTANFLCTGTHKTILSGSSVQKVNFDSTDSHFNIVERKQTANVVLNSPKKGGKGGLVTLQFNGSNLTDTFTAQLMSGSTKIDASKINRVASDVVYATFDLSNAVTGVYDIFVKDNDNTALLEKSFTVVPGVAGDLQFHYSAPQALRPGQKGVLTIDYINNGNIDALPPVLNISTDNARLRLAHQQEFSGSSLQVFDTSTSGQIGVVPPGASGRISVVFSPDTTANSVSFSTNILSDSTKVIDWNAVKNTAKPLDVADDAWNVIWKNFTDAVGNTVNSYLSTTSNDANYLKSLGIDTNDPGRLVGFELLKAGSPFPRAVLTSTYDFKDPFDGLKLDFSRIYMQDIGSRFKQGAFGRGWTHTYDISARTDTDGNVYISMAGITRMFMKNANGTYNAGSGSSTELKLVDGAYNLKEADGTLIVFTTDGKLSSILDSNGNKITAEYNSKGQLGTIKHSNGKSFVFSYSSNGRVDKITSSDGKSKSYSYDITGQYLESVTGPEGTIQYTYWKKPYNVNIVYPREHALLSVAYPGGTHRYFEYDDKGRLGKEYADGNKGAISYTYDSLGRVYETNALGGSTVYAYNDLGLPSSVTDPIGRITQYKYNEAGNLIEVKLPGDITSTYSYDAKGYLIKQTGPDMVSKEMTYDPATNRLLKISESGSPIESYSYDKNGNIAAIADAGHVSSTYERDSSGKVTKVTNRRGQSTGYTYNSNGAITEKVSDGASKTTNTYDTQGRLSTITDVNGTTSMQYDAADHLTKVVYPSGQNISYAYDNGGRRSKVVYSDGYTVNYTYDMTGQLVAVTDGANKDIARYTYDSMGRNIRRVLGNGTYTVYDYDAASQVSKIVNYTANGAINSKFEYVYDSIGRVTRTTTLDGVTSYGYDVIGQLTSVKLPNGRSISYAYDAKGNRSKVTDNGSTTSYTSNTLNQYTGIGNNSYAYDKDGNMISKTTGVGKFDYTYNNENTLTSIHYQNVETKFDYDPFGNLSGIAEGSKKTNYLNDPTGIGNVLEEYDSSGKLASRYIQGIGLVGKVNSDNSINYYDTDNMGSVVGITDQSGSYVNQYSYLPFGEISSATEKVSNPFKFVGQRGVMDEGSGLYYMRARFYDSNSGRFTSPDPMGVNGGESNFYTYAFNNPLLMCDPDGRNPFIIAGAIIGTVCSVGAYMLTTNSSDWTVGGFVGSALGGAITGAITGAVGPGASFLGVLGSGAGSGIGNITKQLIDTGTVDWKEAGISTGVGLAAGLLPWASNWKGISGSFYSWGYYTRNNVFMLFPHVKSLLDYLIKNNAWGSLLNFLLGIIRSRDPNDIVGPTGYGDKHWIPANDSMLDYTIHFENAKDATAAAQMISVREKLDSDLAASTFCIGTFGFGDYVFDVPQNTHTYQKRLDLSKEIGLYLDVEAGIDESTNDIYWTLQSIDPATGEPPEDAFAGFLPPDKVTGEGQGFVTYSIKPLSTIKNGTVIDAKAKIIFDTNDAIDTPAIFNTFDSAKPTSKMVPLEASTLSNDIPLTWTSADGTDGAGVKSVSIYVSKDSQPFELFKSELNSTSTVFPGQSGHTYSFFTLAEDNAGYREEMKTTAEAATYTANVPKTVNITAAPTSIKADGSSTSTISVKVLNENGTPLKGQIVNFTVDNGFLSQSSAVTDDMGSVNIQYTSGNVPGTATLTAIVGDGDVKITNKVAIDLQPTISIVYGDVSGDRKVAANDYALIRDFVLKRIKAFPSSDGLSAADVSGDGKVAANDYALVRDYVLKRIAKFPVQLK